MAEMRSRGDLMRRADELAGNLEARGVGRNLVRPVLDALLRGDGDWDERRRYARQILKLAPVSWLRRRSRGMPDQLHALEAEIGPLLDGRTDQQDVCFVLSWVTRLLKVRGKD